MSRNPLTPRPAVARRLRLAALWTCTCLTLVGAAAIPASTGAPTTVAEAAAPAPAVEQPASPDPRPSEPAPSSSSPAADIAVGEPAPQEPDPAEEPPQAPQPPTPPARPQPPAARSSHRPVLVDGDPRSYAATLVDSQQFSCLNPLWERESGWNPYAVNRSSGAYGIPQALGHGHPYDLGDYRAQIEWGLNYISTTYGSPCRAWSFWQAHHWY